MFYMLRKNKNLAIISLILLVNSLGYGIIIPIIYAQSTAYGLNDFQNGLLFSLFSLCQFVATPIIGRLSDKHGRRPLLIGSITGTALSFFMLAFAPNAIFLFLARALDGITAGNVPVAQAVISDTTEGKERAGAFGIIFAAFGLGFTFGPAISGLTYGIWAPLPFVIAGIITVIAAILTYLFLPETNKHLGEVRQGKLFDLPKLWHALFDKSVGLTFIISLIYNFAFACAILYGYQPFVLKVLGLSVFENAMLFTLFGVVGFITQTFFVQRYANYFGTKRGFMIALAAAALAFTIMFFSRSLPVFIVAAVIMGIFNGLAQTLIVTILSLETDAKSQGTIMGLNASYQSIGFIFGPIFGGLVASYFLPLPLLAGAVCVAICFLLASKILQPGVKKESAF
jgi:MFS family permease